METIISVAVSIDGYIDDSLQERLVLSNQHDWDRVYRLRAECDAILIGAGTLRNDNPSLATKTTELKDWRRAADKSCDPAKVVVSHSCEIDPSSKFFTTGDGTKFVVTTTENQHLAEARFGTLAEIIALPSPISAAAIIDALQERGIRRLMVEGGSKMLKMFLESGYVDTARVAIAPFFVGDEGGVRLLSEGVSLFSKENRMNLMSVEKVDDMMVAHYDTRSADRRYLMQTLALASKCPRSTTAYSVGAMIVTQSGQVFEGYSRKTSPINHAEEEAILAAQEAGAQLEGATIYSSMEPCSQRSSKPLSCSALIIRNKFRKVVFAVAEPENFVHCTGKQMLQDAGIEVIVMADLAQKALEPNRHIVL